MPETATPTTIPPLPPTPSVTNQPVNHRKPFLPVATIAAILLISGLAFGSYQLGKSQSPNTTVSIAKSLTAEWKTYTNRESGFSIDYPNAWNQGDEKTAWGSVVVLTPAPVEKIGFQVQAVYIQVQHNPKHITSMQYYDQVLKPGQVGSVCTNPLINAHVPSPLKNIDATVIEGTCGVLSQGPRMVVVTKDNYIVDISSSFIDEVDNNLIYQILATFKFLDQKDETAEWKTYRNEKYGFGFNYPSGWGDAQEKTMTYGPNEYERGKSYVLTFSGNLKARGGGVSSDFTRPMSGSDETFSGNSQKPKNIGYSIYVGLPGCEERYFQTYNGWVEFNLPGKEISGFRLILPILSQTEIQKFTLLYPISGDGSCPVGSKEMEQAQQHAGDIMKKIETGDIDKESRENLQIFKDVIKSAYVF